MQNLILNNNIDGLSNDIIECIGYAKRKTARPKRKRTNHVKASCSCVILCGHSQCGGVFPTSIYSFIPAVERRGDT